MASVLMLSLALLPGMPMLPFLALSALAGGARLELRQQAREATPTKTAAKATAAAAPPAEEPISTALRSTCSASSSATGCCPDQRRPRAAAHRPDQGAAPPARQRDGLRACRRCASRTIMQLAANTYVDPRQGDRGRPRRTAARHAAGDGPARRADRAARRAHHRAGLRPAGAVDRPSACARKRCSAATPWSIRRPCSPRI